MKLIDKYNSLKHFALTKGMTNEEAEDFRGWAIIKILEREKQNLTNPQFRRLYVDYLRNTRGSTRSNNDDARKKFNNPTTKDVETCEKNGYVSIDYNKYEKKLGTIKGLSRMMFVLKNIYGYSSREIAFMYGCHETRISQILDDIEKLMTIDILEIPHKMNFELDWVKL